MLRGDEEIPNVYARTLKRAAQIVGGEDRLAALLKVTPSNLASWIHGIGTPPANVFLEAVDLVTADGVSRLTPPRKQE
ncbi:MAG TPA: hypothetical protein VFB08_21640 [Burkholderiales bacterium]|nr:hypothetical protein [Burkholderiales bacterium]